MKGFNSRFEYTGKIFSEREGGSINTIQSEKTEEKKIEEKWTQLKKLCDTTKLASHLWTSVPQSVEQPVWTQWVLVFLGLLKTVSGGGTAVQWCRILENLHF